MLKMNDKFSEQRSNVKNVKLEELGVKLVQGLMQQTEVRCLKCSVLACFHDEEATNLT
jgi:hypothetical protein